MAIVSGFDPKPKVKSKTLWLNGVVVVLGVVAEFIVDNVAQTGTGWTMILLGAANYFLRFATKKPIV